MTINITYTQSCDFSLTSYSMSPVGVSTIGDGAQPPSASTGESAAPAPASTPTSASPAPASAPVSTPPASALVDRVELSSDATAQTASATGSSDPQSGDALFSALDANKDGSITGQEFTDGATALLRQAGARHHHRHVRRDDDPGHGDHVTGSGRLERTLEKLFDRVDANHDGSIDKGELANALAQASPSAAAPLEQAPAAPTENQPSVVSVTSMRVSYVAVAVEQYTAIGQMR